MSTENQNLSIDVPVEISLPINDANPANDSESDGDIDDDHASLIIDTGSSTTKAGYAGHDAPTCVFPSIVSKESDKYFVGDDVILKERADNDKSISHPIVDGYIQNWNEVEEIWKYTFESQLKINPKDHGVLLTESAQNPKTDREKTTQAIFETFSFQNFYIAMQSVLALYASGRTTGISMNCGYNVTRVVPIYEGYAMPHAIMSQSFGGNDINKYMKELFSRKDINISMSEIDKMKTEYAYICEDGIENEFERGSCTNPDWLISAYLRDIDGYNAMSSSDVESICNQYIGDKNEFIRQKKKYKLPDGKVIDCTDEICQSVEMLFNPHLIGNADDDGIDKMLYSAIRKLSVSIRRDMYHNVVMSGGTSLIRGYSERLNKGINSIATHITCKVIAPPERLYSAWIGGSILSSLSTFSGMWIDKEEYEETGPAIVHKKCF